MAKIKTNINFSNSCILSLTDTTGFKSVSNLDGFVAEDGTYDDFNDYKVSDGYFINLLIYHKYYGDPKLLNPNDLYFHINSIDVKPVYADNFSTNNYTLTKDGVYTFKRVFVITKQFYEDNLDTGRFDDKEVIYYDPDLGAFYEVTEGTPDEITITDVANKFSNKHAGSVAQYKFVSTCYLNKCLYLIQKSIIDANMAACASEFKDLLTKRDLIHMTLQVIKYLKDDGHLDEVQRVIEGLDTCGMICESISKKNNTDCGCN